jgi:membrane protein
MPARILRGIFTLFTESARGWSRRNPDLLSAALAHNTILSLAPQLLLIITIAGAEYRTQAIREIITQVDRWGGRAVAALVADMPARAACPPACPVLTIVSVVILAWGASGMVLRLRAAINTMWELAPVDALNVKTTLRITLSSRLVAMGIVLAIGFLLFALLLLNTLAVTLYSVYLQHLAPDLNEFASRMTYWVSLLLYLCIFALTFKLLPQGALRWRGL